MLKTIVYLQKISVQSYRDLRVLQSSPSEGGLKVRNQLKRTINFCQKAIAQERRNAYQARRMTMQNRRPV